MTRTLRVVGKLLYDEGNLKTLSAYVDGRLEKLYADYTGVIVHEGDKLALVYSPDLYAGQVEMLLAKKAVEDSQSSTLRRVALSNRELYESSKRRLIELGMTESQLAEIDARAMPAAECIFMLRSMARSSKKTPWRDSTSRKASRFINSEYCRRCG